MAWGRGLGVLLPVPLLPGPPEGQWAVRGLRVTAVCEEGCVSFCLCGYPSKCKHLLWLFKISRCYWVTVLQVVKHICFRFYSIPMLFLLMEIFHAVSCLQFTYLYFSLYYSHNC